MPDFPGTFKPPRLAAPPGSPVVGQMYYDTGTNLLYYWNGTAWVSTTAQSLSSDTFEYVYSGTLTAPPGSGEIRGSGTGLIGTHLYVSNADVDGRNVSTYLQQVKVGMEIVVAAKADTTRRMILKQLYGVTAQTGYVDYNYSGQQGSGLVAGERVIVSFTPVEQVPTPLVNSKWLTVQGGAMVWANPATGELDYKEITADVSVTATTEATAVTVVTSNPIACDGSPVVVEFWAASAYPLNAANANIAFWLFQDGASIGRIGFVQTPAAGFTLLPVSLRRRFTPTVASHTFSIRASASASPGNVSAGLGGPGGVTPAFLRVTRA